MLQPLFKPQASGRFTQKSQEISPRRKFLEGNRCPEAQPLLRPEKTKAMPASILQKGSAFERRKQDRETAEAFLAQVLGFPSRLWSERPSTLHLWGRVVGFFAPFWSGTNHGHSCLLERGYECTLPATSSRLTTAQFFGNWSLHCRQEQSLGAQCCSDVTERVEGYSWHRTSTTAASLPFP